MTTTIDRIKKLIEETGATVRELAEAAGCSKSAMQRYISGERDIPTSVIIGLADMFHVHPAYLFCWVDDRNYNPDKEKPVAMTDDELSASKREMLDMIDSFTEEEAERMLQLLKLALGREGR